MKKIFRGVAILAATAALGTGVAFAAGCADAEKTGEAYALVHSTGSYIGYVSITYKGDEITDLYLTEVVLPNQSSYVNYADGDSTVAYTQVKYDNVTITNNDGTWTVGTSSLKDYFQSEANCKAYYEAAMGNKIVGTKADGTTETINKSKFSKETNGYGGTRFDWKGNVKKTVDYVLEYGVDNLLKLTKDGTWKDGTIDTGATWTDLNPGAAPDGSTSYAQLIVNAYNAAK